MLGDYYYNTRICKNLRTLIKPRFATLAGTKYSLNFGPGQSNKFTQHNTFLTTLNNNLFKKKVLQIIKDS